MKDYIALELLTRRVVDDLIEMHSVGAIELEQWDNAKRLVNLFYHVNTQVVVGGKRED